MLAGVSHLRRSPLTSRYPIQTLRDGRRELSRSTEAFHTQGLCMSLCSVGFTGTLYSEFAGTVGVHLGRADSTAVYDLSRLRAHDRRLQRPLPAIAIPLEFATRNSPAAP